MDTISSDVAGLLNLDEQISQPCSKSRCLTLKTIHTIWLRALPTRCNQIDLGGGTLALFNLVTAFAQDGGHRGVHRGQFVWTSPGIVRRSVVYGAVVGVTNVGTHRGPSFPPCQSGCDESEVMEGQLIDGVFELYNAPRYRGATLSGAYRTRSHRRPTAAWATSGEQLRVRCWSTATTTSGNSCGMS